MSSSSKSVSNLRSDVLLEIVTFLSRRWSNNANVTVSIVDNVRPNSDIEKNQITIPTLNSYNGTEFQKYRQWRTVLWYESMRIRYSTKVKASSYDHAYGFILNCLETKRVEIIGLRTWHGMENEVIFNEAMSSSSRTLLNNIYGKQKIIEAFSQYFQTGYIKGELFGSENDRVKEASDLAHSYVNEAIEKNHDSSWIYDRVKEIIKKLQIDPLLSISLPGLKSPFGISVSKSEILENIDKILKTKSKEQEVDKDETKKLADNILESREIEKEYETLLHESKKTYNRGFENLSNFDISIPDKLNIDETKIYDVNLIHKVKKAFRDWKTGWKETQNEFGDEFDADSYIDTYHLKPFLMDYKITIRSKVIIILDHSSSVEDVELKYKQTTVALCEALDSIGVKFAVYAFSTEGMKIKCWQIKPPKLPWSITSARRLAQIKASGGTPLGEIYGILLPFVKSFKPDICITLTDGEPSNLDAVRDMILMYRNLSIHMAALGLGKTHNELMTISQNLQYLNFNKILAGGIEDIPTKVISLLRID